MFYLILIYPFDADVSTYKFLTEEQFVDYVNSQVSHLYGVSKNFNEAWGTFTHHADKTRTEYLNVESEEQRNYLLETYEGFRQEEVKKALIPLNFQLND